VAPETKALMQRMVEQGEVDALVPERVWQELSRGLMEQKPSRMFEVLRDCGALARILPELDALWGVPQPPLHHPEIDTGVHMMLVIDYAAARGHELPVRFAALMHDLGKGVTPADSSGRPTTATKAWGRALIDALSQAPQGAERLPRPGRDDGARARQRQPRAGAAPEHHRHPVRALRRLPQAGALRPDAAGGRMRFPRPRRPRRRFRRQAVSAAGAPAARAAGGASGRRRRGGGPLRGQQGKDSRGRARGPRIRCQSGIARFTTRLKLPLILTWYTGGYSVAHTRH
jgi:hypothetical protein